MRWIFRYLKTAGDNFGVVAAGVLYRSATPKPANLEKWKTQYGLKTWLDLRMPKDSAGDESFFADQCATACYLEINRISLPLDDFGVASNEQIEVAMSILSDKARWPIQVCCRGGRHRAGMIVALYQKSRGVSQEDILEMLTKHGFYSHGHKVFHRRLEELLGFKVDL